MADNAGLNNSENSVASVVYPGKDNKPNHIDAFNHWIIIDIVIVYKQITYKLNNVDFILFELANFEANPNKKANTGQAKANVYINGFQ